VAITYFVIDMKRLKAIRIIFNVSILLILIGFFAFGLWRQGFFARSAPPQFSGQQAFAHVTAQMNFGPRIPGSEGSLAAGDYIADQLKSAGWSVEFQPFEYKNTPVRNIIAKANVGQGPVIILGAHYDTRRQSDQDATQPTAPVPGANDGASGVAVLLELARTLDLQKIPNELWLAFFDAEDNGDLDGWDWIVGSTYMAGQLTTQSEPEAMILVDMVGDADQQLYFDTNSDPELSAQIWATAAELGYGDYFIPTPRWTMIDDHIPFAQRGIPAIDIIDFDYPYWHTTADTTDKVSAESLERVGRTVKAFLEKEK
jgi:glutaminyl-peptide cyclotransferase